MLLINIITVIITNMNIGVFINTVTSFIKCRPQYSEIIVVHGDGSVLF